MKVSRTKKAPKQYLSWFEIPVLDLERSVSFFNFLYGIKMDVVEQQEYAMAMFPSNTGIGGALVQGQGCTPSEAGALLYLNTTEDMEVMLSRVTEGGGRIVMGKTEIGDDAGYFSLFIDTEGNRLAFHSNK